MDEWLRKAAEDEQSIRAMIRGEGGAPSTICFLSQQMTEKYLKAFLVGNDREFPKVHDLQRLLELCLHSAPELEGTSEDIVLLSDYYVNTRYPGDYPEFTDEDASLAFVAALRVKELVRSLIDMGALS